MNLIHGTSRKIKILKHYYFFMEMQSLENRIYKLNDLSNLNLNYLIVAYRKL